MKRTFLVAPLVLLLVLAIAPLAQAHPAYKDSSPAAGATVSSPPTEVWVEFTERIEDGTLTVIDPCGEQVDHGEEEMNLTMDRLTTTTHGDKAGTYTVQWSVLGSDSHATKGEFTFTSSDGAACPGEEEPDPDPTNEPRTDRERREPSVGNESDDGDGDTSSDRSISRHRDRHQDKATHNHKEPKDRVKGRRETREFAQTTPGSEVTTQKSIWDGIPLGDFLIALAVAALIGAAGGRIYAGIVGPRR